MQGRVAVATRDIPCREVVYCTVLYCTVLYCTVQVVLEDEAVALSPGQEEAAPGCLGCCGPLAPHLDTFTCTCGFPLCSASCAAAELHQPECQLFVRLVVSIRIRSYVHSRHVKDV